MKKLRTLLTAALLLAGAGALYAQQAAAPEAGQENFTGKLFTAKGEVYWQKAGTADWQPVKAPFAIDAGDKIKTGRKARAEIYMRHGVKVRLEPGTVFVLNSAAREEGAVEVAVGRLQAWIRKQAGRRFTVRTPTAVCAVRGTVLEVEVAETGESAWNLFRGSIEVTPSAPSVPGQDPPQPVLLAENQRVTVLNTPEPPQVIALPPAFAEPREPPKTPEEKREIQAEIQAAKAAPPPQPAPAPKPAPVPAPAPGPEPLPPPPPTAQEPSVIPTQEQQQTQVSETCLLSPSTPGCN